MNDAPSGTTKATLARKAVLGLVVLALVGVGALAYWTATCPCDGTPGFVLLGERSDQPVTDWSFANDVPLCQLQLGMGMRPHSINLNCMATPDGSLYLSCSRGEAKYWCPRVGSDERARLRLDGDVYPVVLNRVMDEPTLDKAWAARIGVASKERRARRPVPTSISTSSAADRSWRIR